MLGVQSAANGSIEATHMGEIPLLIKSPLLRSKERRERLLAPLKALHQSMPDGRHHKIAKVQMMASPAGMNSGIHILCHQTV